MPAVIKLVMLWEVTWGKGRGLEDDIRLGMHKLILKRNQTGCVLSKLPSIYFLFLKCLLFKKSTIFFLTHPYLSQHFNYNAESRHGDDIQFA